MSYIKIVPKEDEPIILPFNHIVVSTNFVEDDTVFTKAINARCCEIHSNLLEALKFFFELLFSFSIPGLYI